ncbi:unnamed protein product [Paramecium sonneborni]|uniref:Uncharacterized protein n=1 Tax=Paramecium sonneborni TaxID=65129 RepID=A0A8S1RS78_9CILI|nr:unnamed protein product [Paramecium sonneborni]
MTRLIFHDLISQSLVRIFLNWKKLNQCCVIFLRLIIRLQYLYFQLKRQKRIQNIMDMIKEIELQNSCCKVLIQVIELYKSNFQSYKNIVPQEILKSISNYLQVQYSICQLLAFINKTYLNIQLELPMMQGKKGFDFA